MESPGDEPYEVCFFWTASAAADISSVVRLQKRNREIRRKGFIR